MGTVAAVSTPEAAGGIAVIRISGSAAFDIAEKIFKSVGGQKVAEMKGYTCAYGGIYDGKEKLDECILTVFRSPHSYTGEDVAEISCHGGIYVTKSILRLILRNGAEIAPPGEFTKRAFLNGKIDLTQAESVMDVISAKSQQELKMASNLKEGLMFKKTQSVKAQLLMVLGDLAAWADYPEEDIEAVEPNILLETLIRIETELSRIIEGYDYGRILRDGVNTVIIGKPNVGKSTLFNCLNGCERSIVTDIAGTTRDIVEETVKLGDIVLRLSDTAGVRQTDDIIEEIGVSMALKRADEASLVIAVFDGSCPLEADDLTLLERLQGYRCLAVINKSDEMQRINGSFICEKIPHTVYISAKDGTGIEEIRDAVSELLGGKNFDSENSSSVNERQKCCIDKAIRAVREACEAVQSGVLLDAVTVILEEAVQSLLELTGEKITEAVVDEVFSRFCVGK